MCLLTNEGVVRRSAAALVKLAWLSATQHERCVSLFSPGRRRVKNHPHCPSLARSPLCLAGHFHALRRCYKQVRHILKDSAHRAVQTTPSLTGNNSRFHICYADFVLCLISVTWSKDRPWVLHFRGQPCSKNASLRQHTSSAGRRRAGLVFLSLRFQGARYVSRKDGRPQLRDVSQGEYGPHHRSTGCCGPE